MRSFLVIAVIIVAPVIVWLSAHSTSQTVTHVQAKGALPPNPNEKGVEPTPTAKAAAEKQAIDSKKHHLGTLAYALQLKILRNSMRNPDSFKLNNALIMDDGTACYDFRAQNGFGGMNVGHAVYYPGANGGLLGPPGQKVKPRDRAQFKTSEMPGFNTVWNKSCAGQTGEDWTEKISYIAENLPKR